MMDLSSPHVPYVFGAYALVLFVFILFTVWVLSEDRKVQHQLAKFKSDAA